MEGKDGDSFFVEILDGILGYLLHGTYDYAGKLFCKCVAFSPGKPLNDSIPKRALLSIMVQKNPSQILFL